MRSYPIIHTNDPLCTTWGWTARRFLNLSIILPFHVIESMVFIFLTDIIILFNPHNEGVPTFGLIIYANTIVCADLEKGGDKAPLPWKNHLYLRNTKNKHRTPTSMIPTFANTIITLIPPPTSSWKNWNVFNPHMFCYCPGDK